VAFARIADHLCLVVFPMALLPSEGSLTDSPIHSAAPERPPKERKRVVAAVIDRDDRLLICLRPPEKQHGGLWEFPGGKIHADETVAAAVARELKEELAVTATHVGDVLFSTYDQRSGFEILFLPTQIVGEPQALEHSAITWCARSDLLLYTLAPSDEAFASFLMKEAA
jgi:mutator protein MutT